MAFFHEKELKQYVRELKSDWRRAEKAGDGKWLRRLAKEMDKLDNIVSFEDYDLFVALNK